MGKNNAVPSQGITNIHARAACPQTAIRTQRDKELGILDTDLKSHLERHSLSHLPQAGILSKLLKAVSDDNLLEAYLRGSFSTGEADDYSDIDLFLVTKKDGIEDTFGKFLDHLQSTYNVLSICHDKLVKDYGGIGFMAVIKDSQGRLVQCDVYLVSEGQAPLQDIWNAPRIFSASSKYSVFCEENKAPYVEQPFAKLLANLESQELSQDEKNVHHLVQDIFIALFIENKHLNRGQFMRARNDDHHITQQMIEMAKIKLGYKTHHTPLYCGDSLLKDCSDSRDYRVEQMGKNISELGMELPSKGKIIKTISFLESYLHDFFPKLVKEFEVVFAELKEKVDPSYERPENTVVPFRQIAQPN